jgi:hypothetical protein
MSALICVLNHYSRNISDKVEKLKALGLPFEVFTDTSDYRLNKETRWYGVSLNYLRILKHETDFDWKIIIHDDIDIDNNLFDKIKHILNSAPKSIVSFYNPTNKAYRLANESGKHIFSTYSNWWTQCHAFPKRMQSDYLKWTEENDKYVRRYAEDGLLWRYLSLKNINIYSVMPSLVQHNGYDKSTFKLPAVVGKNKRNSESYNENFYVYKVDWKSEFKYPYINKEKKYLDEL